MGAVLRPPRGVRVLVLVGAVLGLGSCGGGAVQVDAPQPSGADLRACRELVDRLPDRVADQPRRELEADASGVDGWAAAWGDPAIVLTCGGPAPSGFTRTSTCTTVDGVDWFVPEEQLEDPERADPLTLTTVDRAQYVTVELPLDYWPPAATMVDLAPAVTGVARQGGCG